MKPSRPQQIVPNSKLRSFFAACGWLGIIGIGGTQGTFAQEAVTSITTTTIVGVSSTNSVTPIGGGAAFNVVYTGTQKAVATIVTASGTYAPSLTGQAYARRNNGSQVAPVFSNTNANQTSAWNVFSGTVGTTRIVQGEYHGTMESLLTNNDLNTGTENLFVNNGSNTDPSSNIERVDFMFGGTTGITVGAGQAFSVFERGGTHGTFHVAVVTAVDGAGVPTAYDDTLILVDSSDYGANLNSFNYDIYRNSTPGGTNLNVQGNANLGPQGAAGVLIQLSSFGLANGTTFYGYSLYGADVTTTNPANLVNWNNSAIFPQNPTFPSNDMDMVASGATLFVVVPEPATAALAVGGLALAFVSRRRTRSAHA